MSFDEAAATQCLIEIELACGLPVTGELSPTVAGIINLSGEAAILGNSSTLKRLRVALGIDHFNPQQGCYCKPCYLSRQ